MHAQKQRRSTPIVELLPLCSHKQPRLSIQYCQGDGFSHGAAT